MSFIVANDFLQRYKGEPVVKEKRYTILGICCNIHTLPYSYIIVALAHKPPSV